MKIYAILFVAIFLFAKSNTSIAQSGFLDNTFGGIGNIVTNLPSGNNCYGYAVVVQDDGKIIVVGGSHGFTLVRYLSNSDIDSTYGSNGFVVHNISGLGDGATTAILLPDGKLLVGGSTGFGDFAIVRFDSTGQVDSTFGIAGEAIARINGTANNFSNSMILQPDGKIIIAGSVDSAGDNNFGLMRFTSTGFLDSQFGIGGAATADFGYDDNGYGVAILGNGKIVMCGQIYYPTGNGDFGLACFNSDGTPDIAFGINGKLVTDFPGLYNGGRAIAAKSNDQILVAGSYHNPSPDFALIQYNSNGSIDSSFGSNGTVFTEINASDWAYCVTIQKDGKILVGGESGNSANYKFTICRYNIDGSLDNTFGFGGKAQTPFGGDGAEIHSMAIQKDGKIVAAGTFNNASLHILALARYNSSTAYFNVYPDTIPHNWVVINQSSGTQPISYEWSWGDGDSSSGPTPSHTYATPGFYNICLTMTDANNCVSTYCDSSTYLFRTTSDATMIYISVYNSHVVGVNQPDPIELNFNAYPNPSKGEVTIMFSSLIKNGSLTIYNAIGKIVISEIISNELSKTVTLPDYCNGVYFMKLFDGERYSDRKIVVN